MSAGPPDTPRVVACERLPIALAKLLKRENLTQTGGEAKRSIREGRASVNGVLETRPGRKLLAGDVVTFAGQRVVIVQATSADFPMTGGS